MTCDGPSHHFTFTVENNKGKGFVTMSFGLLQILHFFFPPFLYFMTLFLQQSIYIYTHTHIPRAHIYFNKSYKMCLEFSDIFIIYLHIPSIAYILFFLNLFRKLMHFMQGRKFLHVLIQISNKYDSHFFFSQIILSAYKYQNFLLKTYKYND